MSAIVIRDQSGQSHLHALQLAEQIAKIVRDNLTSGRAQRVMGNRRERSSAAPMHLEQYVDSVIALYLAEHQRVKRLAACDNEEWFGLQMLLAKRAFRILQRWPAARQQPSDEAADFAQQTCESIFNTIFPYDVPFAAWATVILTNHIRQRYMRSRDLIDRSRAIESLDHPNGGDPDHLTSLYEILNDPAADEPFEKIDLQQQLLDAIARLPSQAQQDVVIYSFLYGWSDEQLAQRAGKTKQAIYNLRHRALQQLRQILSQEMHPKDN
ncbi:MAG TPA: sigma-70 family RNA polymerase sigma factor [Anaerolineae bacterium]